MAVDLERCERYLCVMLRGLAIILLVVLPAAAWAVQTGRVSQESPAEYMIYQYPGVALVVKIDAPEVTITSRIFGPEETLLMSSEVPSARIGPLYQFVPQADIPRQLMIKVSPERSIERSAISLELIQLPTADPNSADLAQAYRLLSYGTEQIYTNDTTTWAMKAYTLRNAASAFASLGWEEMRLLSEFYAAHLVLHKLNDELLAVEMAREIRIAARKAGIEWIELAALILESDSLTAAAGKSSGSVAQARYEQVHAVLDEVVLVAQRQGMQSEQARALYNDALIYRLQDQQEAAIRQLQRALNVSFSADNPDLVNEIRGTAAATYEALGSTTNAISMLQDIGAGLEGGAAEEVTDNLFEKGRLLNDSFRYPEAAQELTQALELRQADTAESGSWGPVGIELAWSWYSMGDMEQAAGMFLQAIPRTSLALNPTALFRAYHALGNIFRSQGEFSRMTQFREKQEALVESDSQRIEYLLDSALDAWRLDGPRSAVIDDVLTRAVQISSGSGLAAKGHRAAFYSCLQKIESGQGVVCSDKEVNRIYRSLRSSGLPKLALEADFILARIRRSEGREREASAAMTSLTAELDQILRTLPGVLGAWYWQSREEIFEEYMALALEQTGVAKGNMVDGASVLLVLDRIRSIESAEPLLSGRVPDQDTEEEFRSLIARLQNARGQEAERLAIQSNSALETILASATSLPAALTARSLQNILGRLASDEVLLCYVMGASGNYVLAGSRKSVSLEQLNNTSRSLPERLNGLREQIHDGSAVPMQQLEEMGQALLGPVTSRLVKRIYLLPEGALVGFPFSALRLNGEFLAEKHEVVELGNLSDATRFASNLPVTFSEHVFLAGNPQTSQRLFNYDLQLSPEISSVTDRFVGPGLQIVQGVALKADEFQDSRFTGADLIHLAMPGTIDLVNPSRSRLLMSGNGNDTVMVFLSPGDLRGLDLRASLVVLSRTAVAGSSPSGFENRLGFVSDFLDMGANAVLFSLWTVDDRDSAAFVNEFYDHLESTRDASKALWLTRKGRLKSGDAANLASWAGFQLFIR